MPFLKLLMVHQPIIISSGGWIDAIHALYQVRELSEKFSSEADAERARYAGLAADKDEQRAAYEAQMAAAAERQQVGRLPPCIYALQGVAPGEVYERYELAKGCYHDFMLLGRA